MTLASTHTDLQYYYLSGVRKTDLPSGGPDATAVGNLDGAPADGTWTFLVSGAFDDLTFNPQVRLFLQGKSITFNANAVLGINNPQLWNWHRTAGAFVDGVSSGSLITDISIAAEEDPQLARFFGPVPNPRVRDNNNGSCTIFNDVNHNAQVDGGETLADIPCAPDLQAQGNPDGTVTVYNDVDHDRQVDGGEAIATTPRQPVLATRDNNDGACTVYDDANRNGQMDGGEALATAPCPDIQLHDNGAGSTTVYDDKDGDRQVDPGEEIATTPETDETSGLEEREVLSLQDIVLTPSQPLPPDDVPGQETPDFPGTGPVATPDYPGTPGQPTPDHGGTGPVATPDVPGTPGQPTAPVGEHVGDVSVHDSGADLCIDFVPDGDAPINVVCINRALLGPAGPMVPRGDTGLLIVDPPDVPPTSPVPVQDVPPTPPVAVPDVPPTSPMGVPDVPSTPPVPVPDVPSTPVGSLGTTPETSITVDIHYHYDPAHVTRLVGVGGGLAELYSPIGPDATELDWLAANAGNVGLEFEVTLYKDGVAQGTVVHSIPVLGQALAAAEATAGTLSL